MQCGHRPTGTTLGVDQAVQEQVPGVGVADLGFPAGGAGLKLGLLVLLDVGDADVLIEELAEHA